jgi:DNA mismatch endonuclease (patch repair protein)
MRANRRRDTGPEMAVRSACHALGLRYGVDRALPLPEVRRKADLSFPRERVAVFVDGCYWHGCPAHFKPKNTGANADWWKTKIGLNRRRDQDTNRRLVAAGWAVIRVYECEVRDRGPGEVAEMIRQAIVERR